MSSGKSKGGKTPERADKGKKKNEKVDKKRESSTPAQSEEDRQREWDEAWAKKLAEEERLDDTKACCAPDKFFTKPKTQTDIWVEVQHEENAQTVLMTFQDGPVVKPKPPPLPPLDPPKVSEDSNKKEKSKKKKK